VCRSPGYCLVASSSGRVIPTGPLSTHRRSSLGRFVVIGEGRDGEQARAGEGRVDDGTVGAGGDLA
jgi:hypothetical protein